MRPGRDEAALEREVASHVLLLEDDYRRRGLSAAEARRSARLALGGIEQTKELHRDARAFRWLDDARRDATYAVRLLRHHPVVTVTAGLSLAASSAAISRSSRTGSRLHRRHGAGHRPECADVRRVHDLSTRNGNS
jgi:hypothetical protein